MKIFIFLSVSVNAQNKGGLTMHPAFKFHISNYLISKHIIELC